MDDLAYVVHSARTMDEITGLLESATPEHGFRILAVHNVQQTLREKGYDTEPLKIFELCNAAFAYEALKSDINVAMFMPCKIIVRPGRANKTIMTLVRPSMISALLPESGLDEMAKAVEEKLIGIMDAVK